MKLRFRGQDKFGFDLSWLTTGCDHFEGSWLHTPIVFSCLQPLNQLRFSGLKRCAFAAFIIASLSVPSSQDIPRLILQLICIQHRDGFPIKVFSCMPLSPTRKHKSFQIKQFSCSLEHKQKINASKERKKPAACKYNGPRIVISFDFWKFFCV